MFVRTLIDLSWSLNNLRAFFSDSGASLVSTVCQTTKLPRLVPVKARLLCVWNIDWVKRPTGLLNVYDINFKLYSSF